VHDSKSILSKLLKKNKSGLRQLGNQERKGSERSDQPHPVKLNW
jgi:hypothetical protein